MPCRAFWGPAVQAHFFSFALFVGMNLANSANPVIARILMDLGLLTRSIGALIMSATIVDDLVNWTLFAMILGDIAPSNAAQQFAVKCTSSACCSWSCSAPGAGSVRPRSDGSTPCGLAERLHRVMALLVLLASSASEALGVHAFLGAFLIGAALGDTRDHHKDAHDVIGNFVTSFAPIFFISMGMSTNFIANFDALLVVIVLVAACVTKVGAVLLGARAAGMPLDREVWAIAFGLNARGATGIILAGVGLANGVIDARIFVAMVFMAAVTSLMAGPMMSRLLEDRSAPSTSA